MEINETILRFKLNSILDYDLKKNGYDYVLRIKDMDTKKICNDIDLYLQCKEREDNTELRILYKIVLEYLNNELQYRLSI